MTHEELIASIKRRNLYDYANTVIAVVELHRPTPEGRYPENLCQGCSMTEEGIYVYYPCQTIGVIEAALT